MENKDEKYKQILASKSGTVILISGRMEFNGKNIIQGKLKRCL